MCATWAIDGIENIHDIKRGKDWMKRFFENI